MDARTRDFVLSTYRASRTLDHAEFRLWVFAALGQNLAFDSGFWLRCTMTRDGPLLHDQHLDRQQPDRLTGYMEDGLWRDDPFTSIAFSERGMAGMMSAADIPSERLRAFLARHYQAHVVYWLEADRVSGIYLGWSLFRADAARPFTEPDRLFVEAVGPIVTDAWTQSWLRQLEAKSPPAKPVGYAQAIVTSAGTLTVVDDRFADALRDEWRDWQGPHLPPELDEHLRAGGHEPYNGRTIVVRFEPLPDRLMRVQVRARHALDSIPKRKRDVAILFASGESQATIADRLSLSSSTVNNYLGDIYRQLNVSGKAQLATLIARLPE